MSCDLSVISESDQLSVDQCESAFISGGTNAAQHVTDRLDRHASVKRQNG